MISLLPIGRRGSKDVGCGRGSSVDDGNSSCDEAVKNKSKTMEEGVARSLSGDSLVKLTGVETGILVGCDGRLPGCGVKTSRLGLTVSSFVVTSLVVRPLVVGPLVVGDDSGYISRGSVVKSIPVGVDVKSGKRSW